MKNEGVMPVLVGVGGANRVKEMFHQGGHLGLIMCQLKIYLHAKYGSSKIKNEGVMIVLVSIFYGNTSSSSSRAAAAEEEAAAVEKKEQRLPCPRLRPRTGDQYF